MAPPFSSWRTPSVANQAKYNLVPLPEDFEPTKQEEELLEMYETIRMYEKEAARIKEQAAKDKLNAANVKFQQSLEKEEENDVAAPVKKKRKKARKKKARQEGTNATEDMDDEELESSDEEDNEEEDLHERREAKLAEMREQVDEAKRSQQSEAAAAAEALRQKHLATGDEAVNTAAITIERKRLEEPKEKSSLIANLGNQETPPHDFSQSLGIKSYAGKVLFPTSTDVSSWSPPSSATTPNEGAMTYELGDFDISQAQMGNGNNTLAIKFMAPTDSKRFSINISVPDHQDFYDVLFHFNPRQHERGGQVVVNDKTEGIWGQGINIPLSQLPLIFGQVACTLVIQINGDGFDVFLENEHCARLEHRRQLPSKRGPLILQFPSTDDYGSPEAWTVYRVWWGNKAVMAKGDLSRVPGVNVFDNLHPRKLFISGLPPISTDAEVDLRRAELERAFRKYGGDRGVITVTVPINKSFAFVELESERQADLALQEMQSEYRLNRARRSKHEALQEARAAEAAKGGPAKESSEWD